MISKIEIKKYKKFNKSTTLYFDKGVNLLIGENNGGKTTLLNLIDSFLKNDIKFFKDIIEKPEKPEILITFSDKIWRLNTTSKAWKWENMNNISEKHCDFPHGYLSAHPNIEEVNNSIKNLFINQIKENDLIINNLNSEKSNFKNNLIKIINETISIQEKKDDYTFLIETDWSKAFKCNFDSSNIKNIINKGLGQQKEFIIKNYALLKNEVIWTYLIIDEIENSLSLQSLSKIIDTFQEEEENKQYFISSHSPEILRLVNNKNISVLNIGEKIPNISTWPNEIIFCEGSSDTNLFKKIWINTLFISSGGANLKDISKDINDYQDKKEVRVKFIVDGDIAGGEYEKKINQMNNKNILVHKLLKGTPEDYCKESEIIKILDKHTFTLDKSKPVPNNILEYVRKHPKLSHLKEVIKEELKPKIEEELLKNELNDFVEK